MIRITLHPPQAHAFSPDTSTNTTPSSEWLVVYAWVHADLSCTVEPNLVGTYMSVVFSERKYCMKVVCPSAALLGINKGTPATMSSKGKKRINFLKENIVQVPASQRVENKVDIGLSLGEKRF